ncbi:MAG: hypothetical protein QOJ03_416 [Frankiaceae bacterium]|jgi:hypothetical protein|nr:hypothetical protein [Frankiaceae bacterium]
MTVLAGFYKDPLPGFIFTAIVMTILISWVGWIYYVNFGSKAAKQRNAEQKAADARARMPTP